MLDSRQRELDDIEARFAFIVAIHTSLIDATKGKRFMVYNIPLWNMMVGALAKVYIDIASWTKAFYSRKGILRVAQSGDAQALRYSWDHKPESAVWAGEGEPDEAVSRSLDQIQQVRFQTWRGEAFARLFPCARNVRDVPSAHDFDALATDLSRSFEALHAERHVRAHAFEADQGDAKALSPDEVRPFIDRSRQLLDDLRSLGTGGGFRSPPTPAPTDDEVRDVVDLILFGTVLHMVAGPMYRDAPPSQSTHIAKRLAYYARMHSEHDAAGAREDAPFNRRSR